MFSHKFQAKEYVLIHACLQMPALRKLAGVSKVLLPFVNAQFIYVAVIENQNIFFNNENCHFQGDCLQ